MSDTQKMTPEKPPRGEGGGAGHLSHRRSTAEGQCQHSGHRQQVDSSLTRTLQAFRADRHKTRKKERRQLTDGDDHPQYSHGQVLAQEEMFAASCGGNKKREEYEGRA